jgi:pyroglutamyl-peptidase
MVRHGFVLITGFGPYPHVRINPTAGLAHAVARTCRARGFAARALVLETSYGRGLRDLTRAIEGDAHARNAPAAVLMLGLAPRSRFVRVELFARAGASPLHADARGCTPGGTERREPALRQSLPLRTSAGSLAALARLRRQGLAARMSASAGRYLCNAAYALALGRLGKPGGSMAAPVLFIHLPYPRTGPGRRRGARHAPALAPLRAALSAIAIDLAIAARNYHGAASSRQDVPFEDRRPRHVP